MFKLSTSFRPSELRPLHPSTMGMDRSPQPRPFDECLTEHPFPKTHSATSLTIDIAKG